MLTNPCRAHVVWAAACSIALLTAGAQAAKKNPESIPPLVDEVSVEVVNVDVVVTDRNGVPVAGLKPEDFIILEDGKERAISNFFAFARGNLQLTADQEAEPDGGDRSLKRRMALLFDANSLEARQRDRAIDELEQFIMEQFDGSYEWAVVGYDTRVRLLQPFTSDKTTVVSALARIRDMPVPVRQARATDPTSAEHPVLSRFATIASDLQAGDRPGARILSFEEFELRERMLSGLRKFDRTANAVVETMRAYAALPGRKSLVLVTGALESLPGASQLLGFGLPGVGGPNTVDPLVRVMQSELQKRFDAIVTTANAAGFAIYPVAAKGGLDSKAPYLDVDRETSLLNATDTSIVASEVDVESAPQIMAAGTGGLYYTSQKYYQAFDDIDSRTANAYVLGFETDHQPEKAYHKIKVKVLGPNLRVEFRKGYLHLSRRDRLVEALATPLFFAKDRGDFAVEVQVLPPEKLTKKKADVTVAGVLPMAEVTLIPQGDDLVGRIFLFLAIYDREGLLVNLVREYQDIRLPAASMTDIPEGAPARFAITVRALARGEYTFTLTLMDEISDRYGTGIHPVQL